MAELGTARSPMETLREGGVSAWSAPAFAPAGDGGRMPGAFLRAAFALQPRTWLRRMPGRETFRWPGQPRLVVKRSVGGEARDFWYERLRGGTRSAARREAENLHELREAGFAVPRVLAFAEDEDATRYPRLRGRTGRSVLVMEHVPHAETVRQRLEQSTPAEARRWSEVLAAFVTRLHREGWYHRDLYLQHFVVGSDGELVLLDVGRARRERAPRRRWFVKDLAALWHSTPACVSRSTRLRFLRAWLAARGEDSRAARRDWARAVQVKAWRLARHAPRHVDSER